MTDQHWTRAFIGFDYAAGADGPRTFDCWSFFRHVERQQFGREMPPMLLPVGLIAQYKAFRTQPGAFGCQRIEKPRKPVSGDAVLMSHKNRPHHIGVYVADVPGVAVLHCLEGRGSVLSTMFHLETFAWNITGIYRPVNEEPGPALPADAGSP
jgi:hypothetical protein